MPTGGCCGHVKSAFYSPSIDIGQDPESHESDSKTG